MHFVPAALRLGRRGHRYVLAVKDSQGLLAEQVRGLVSADELRCGQRRNRLRSGRVEQRRCSVIAAPEHGRQSCGMASLQGVCALKASVTTRPRARPSANPLLHHQPQARCGTAEPGDPSALGHRKQTALGARRGLGEDLDRKRAGHAAQNFSLLNRIALNLLKQETTFKRGIKGKRLKAAWNHPYLLKLLGI